MRYRRRGGGLSLSIGGGPLRFNMPVRFPRSFIGIFIAPVLMVLYLSTAAVCLCFWIVMQMWRLVVHLLR